LSNSQLIEQRLGLSKIERIEALSEPAIDRREKVAGLITLALIAPEPPMLIAERSSQNFACCWRATASARR
jgi:hypothetical protein